MRKVSELYPDFYNESREFSALIYTLMIEIIRLWDAYEQFYQHVFLHVENPTLTPVGISNEDVAEFIEKHRSEEDING